MGTAPCESWDETTGSDGDDDDDDDDDDEQETDGMWRTTQSGRMSKKDVKVEGDNARLRSRDAHGRVTRSFTWAFTDKRPQSKTENHTLCESEQSKCTQCRRASRLCSALL